MKVCSQCATPTNRPVRINKEIVCQGCAKKIKLSKCCEYKIIFNNATGDYICSGCRARIN